MVKLFTNTVSLLILIEDQLLQTVDYVVQWHLYTSALIVAWSFVGAVETRNWLILALFFNRFYIIVVNCLSFRITAVSNIPSTHVSTRNLERNRLCRFKIDIRNLTNFDLQSLKSFHFNGLLLSRVYILWAKKVERIYLWWNSRGIQNLERNRLVLSKLT